MMSDAPSDTYLDLDYVGGFYAELSPVRLNFICALNGVAGPDLSGGFDYCELGCGLGETTTLLAASLPQGRFLGIDLSPAHVDAARKLARDGCVGNVRFLAADVARLDVADVPDFDYITMHGLYAWVPDVVRDAIDAFVTRKLKPGGVLHVSYNARPGAHNLATLRSYYLERAAHMTGSLLERATAITEELESLQEQGAPLFRENPSAERLFEMIRSNDRRYLVHEMFAEGWRPFAFSDINARMAACGLRFVGDSEVLENLLDHCTLPDFTPVVARVADRVEQESLKDLIHNRSFRRDVFVRPPATGAGNPGQDPLGSTLLCTTQPASDIASRVKVTGGTLDLSGAWFDRLREMLAFRVLSVDEILNDSVLSGCPRADLLGGLKLAAIEGTVGPAARREATDPSELPAALCVVPDLNRTLLERFDFNRGTLVLASPVTGCGIVLSRIEAMLLAAVDRASPVEWTQNRLRDCGITLRHAKTETVPGTIEEESAALREMIAAFRQVKLPKLAALGIVAGQK